MQADVFPFDGGAVECDVVQDGPGTGSTIQIGGHVENCASVHALYASSGDAVSIGGDRRDDYNLGPSLLSMQAEVTRAFWRQISCKV